MILNIVSISIAIISLFISFYVILRDRKIKRFDNLHTCRQNILNIFHKHDVLTWEEMINYYEENPESNEAKKHLAKSEEITRQIDRELEYTCYLVMNNLIDLKPFYDLFKRWLAMRYLD